MDKKLLILINFNYFGTYLAYTIFPPYFPRIAQDEKGVDQQTIGLIMSFWFIGYSLFAIVMSHVLLRTGRKLAIIIGLVLLSLDFLLATF